ncbi:MAG: L-threonylcarbamoyladenylate synthase [Woeseiaceae bacterium]|nr:L-threonylcarbamoyladenylate synthase [Woeseiaceae bacterium]
MSPAMISLQRAADVLLGGGIIAYPTEGVFGLGCLPDDPYAVQRLLDLKRRDPSKGLIVIASQVDQLDELICLPGKRALPAPDPQYPITWIVPASTQVHPLVRGKHPGLAVRLTSNPVAAALCDAVESAIVSTSANLSGQPTARNRFVLRRQFRARVDFIVPGDCGPARGASEIRDFATGNVLRGRTQ